MGSGDDLAATAGRTLEVVCGVARIDFGGVFRLDEAMQTLTLVAHRGLSPEDVAHLRVRPVDASHVGQAARAGRLLVTDLARSRLLAPEVRERVRVRGYRTQLALPITVDGRTWGVMALISRAPRTFDTDEITLLQAVAHQVGAAVGRAALFTDTHEKSRRLETLTRLAQTLTATLSLDEVLQRVVDAAAELFGSSVARLWLVDDDGSQVSLRAWSGAQTSVAGLGRFRIGEGLIGTVVATRRALTIPDVFADSRTRNVERIRAEGTVSAALVPVLLGDRVLGALSIGVRERHEYTPEEMRLLGSLALHAANAINNARLFEDERQRRAYLAAVLEINKRIGSVTETESLLAVIAEEAARLLDVDNAGFRLVDGDELVVAGLAGSAAETMLRPRIRIGESLSGRVVAEGRTLLCDLASAPGLIPEHLAADQRLGYTTFLGVPLKVSDRTIGVLTFRARRPLAPLHQELAEAFAGQAALALDNARLFEANRRQVAELSVLYELSQAVTGQLDRAVLVDAIRAQVARVLDARNIFIVLRDESRPEFEVALRVIDGVPAMRPPLRYPVGSVGLVSVVFETGRAVRTDDYVAECARHGVEGASTPLRHWLGVPMLAGDTVLGVLALRSGERAFMEADERLLTNIAHLAALALRSARLFEERTRAYGELAAAQDQLVRTEKLRALGEMASGVAHDFNNLLASILGRAQLTLQRVQDPQLRQWLGVIERAALDGAQTVRRLQEFTRIRRDHPFVAVDLNEVVRGALEITQSRWGEEAVSRGVALEVRTSFAELPRVAGDPAELREAMTNLILNAVDAMPRGGVLTLTTAVVDGAVVVAVSDTGEGIPEAIRAKIFDPFFTTKGPHGTGLGLSMTYGILERHGARIVAESAEGRGTTFRMTFAPGAPEEPERAAPAPGAAPEGGPLRCLVVDDEPAVGAMLGDVLESGGHRVVVLDDGAEAIARFRAEAFDVVFTDLAMPRVSGWQVARAVKEIAPTVPVCLVTGFGVELSADERRTQGVDLVLVKPLKIDDILAALAAAARRRAQPIRTEDDP